MLRPIQPSLRDEIAFFISPWVETHG